jgi:hypothetical protein
VKDSWIIRGRTVTHEDVDLIKQITQANLDRGRKHISRELCHAWKWYQPSGHTKDRAARDILLFLEAKNLIQLPPRINSANNHLKHPKKRSLREIPLSGTLKTHPKVELRLLKTARDYAFFNGVVAQYHYQGAKVIVGKSLRYCASIAGYPVAFLAWGSAAWSIESRDKWIGWTKEVKDRSLHKIANNIRFLILPWIRIKYLASHLIALSVKQVPHDWQRQFGSPVYLLETFVEEERFEGTCYKAANWTYLGKTKGSAKRGSFHDHHGNIKKIFVYPLTFDFRDRLMSDEKEIKEKA